MRICALVLCLGLAGMEATLAADPVTIEQIIAKINGDIVTRSELERTRRQAEAEMKTRGATPKQIADAMKDREKDALRDRIDQLLLIQRGKELNINVDSEVTKYIGGIQAENKIADPEKFQQWIREQTGMTYEDFKAEAKNGMLTQRVVQQEVISKVNIPKEEIEDYYNKHKASYLRKERIFLHEILISIEGKDDAGKTAAEKKAKDIVARSRKGERFNELVRDNSDAVTAKQGGDLGGFEKGLLRPDIETLLWDKPRGYVTDPLKVDAGWLILRVDDHQKEGQADLADVENEIREALYGPRITPKVREYLTELRQNAFLEIREGFVDTGAASGKDTSWSDPAMLKPETITKEEVALQSRRKRLLWMMPVPGTSMAQTGKSSSK